MTRRATSESGYRISIRRITTAPARLPILLDLLPERAAGKAGAGRVDAAVADVARADVAMPGAVRTDKAAVRVDKMAVRTHWRTLPSCPLGRPNNSRLKRCVSKWLN